METFSFFIFIFFVKSTHPYIHINPHIHIQSEIFQQALFESFNLAQSNQLVSKQSQPVSSWKWKMDPKMEKGISF